MRARAPPLENAIDRRSSLPEAAQTLPVSTSDKIGWGRGLCFLAPIFCFLKPRFRVRCRSGLETVATQHLTVCVLSLNALQKN